MTEVVIVGGGVAGLTSALALGRQGARVTILERDPVDVPADPDAAFTSWPRRGAPQVHHSHAFLARLRNEFRTRAPDVLDALRAAGVAELRFADDIPPEMTGFVPEPDDDDYVALACRRTTFEWVLRRLVSALPDVAFVHADVRAIALDDDHVTGVVTENGTTYSADLVVDATGPRTALPARLAEAGCDGVVEEADDTGIVYSTRFYRLAEGVEPHRMAGPVAGDLGYLKYAVFAGDNRTFSITFGLWSDDADLRVLLHEQPFSTAAAAIPAVAPWLADDYSTPITDVEVMARLVNRRRRFVVDGNPLFTGLVAVGDAAVCTNPLYGRGCSLATVHAFALTDAIADVGVADPTGLVLAFDDATRRLLDPWYRSSLMQDTAARMLRAGQADDGGGAGAFNLIRDGVLPAARQDPMVWRAFVRTFNLLDEPDAMLGNPDVLQRVMQAFEERHTRPEPEPLGPSRDELMVRLAAGPI